MISEQTTVKILSPTPSDAEADEEIDENEFLGVDAHSVSYFRLF